MNVEQRLLPERQWRRPGLLHPYLVSADGRTAEARSPSVVSFTGYRVGDTIRVEYPPGRPDQAQLVRFVDRWMLEVVLAIIGAAFIAIRAFAVRLTNLPDARITPSGFGFSVQSPVSSVDADLEEPSSPTSSSLRPKQPTSQ